MKKLINIIIIIFTAVKNLRRRNYVDLDTNERVKPTKPEIKEI